MIRFLINTMGCCALLLSGCAIAPTAAPTKDQSPDLAGEWTITMVHSGGIMGLSRSIEVSSDGAYTAMDQRSADTKRGGLSGEELDRLTRLVTSLQYSPSAMPSGCADCFIYDITISGGPKRFTARADDVTLPTSGLEPLVTELRAIMDVALN